METKRAAEIASFFDARVDIYDEHHLSMIDGGMQSKALGDFLPADTARILDLGAGTGLELISVFEHFPNAHVTAIDLAPAMLDRLRARFPGKDIEILPGDYFQILFGDDYDAVISSMTMHHWTPKEKELLFRKIHDALRPGGIYLQNDYMLTGNTPDELEIERLALLETRNNMHSEDSLHIHFDLPSTISAELELLWKAGFSETEELWRNGSNATLAAHRR